MRGKGERVCKEDTCEGRGKVYVKKTHVREEGKCM